VVRLESLRDVAVQTWSPVALRMWRSEERARATTVRETLELSSAVLSTPDILARTELAAYGRSIPLEREVQSIELDAARLTGTRDGDVESTEMRARSKT
jgi:hypothetical protein